MKESKIHEFGLAFRKLGNQEFQVFEFIYKSPFVKFEGNYSDLCRALENNNPSATRKAVLLLQNYGVLGIAQNEFTGKPIFFVRVDWKENLIESTKNVKSPLENIKRPRKKNAE